MRARRAPTRNADALPPAPADLAPERRGLHVVDGVDRTVDLHAACTAGLTAVTLSDDWAPRIFADGTGPSGALLPNRYRAVFIGLANDRTDGDGQPLGRGDKNYLELLGVPPSLSVLGTRMLDDAGRDCSTVDRAALRLQDLRRGPQGVSYGDNGIRTHGSFDYLSLRGHFSRGCYRLYNNLAVRRCRWRRTRRRARRREVRTVRQTAKARGRVAGLLRNNSFAPRPAASLSRGLALLTLFTSCSSPVPSPSSAPVATAPVAPVAPAVVASRPALPAPQPQTVVAVTVDGGNDVRGDRRVGSDGPTLRWRRASVISAPKWSPFACWWSRLSAPTFTGASKISASRPWRFGGLVARNRWICRCARRDT